MNHNVPATSMSSRRKFESKAGSASPSAGFAPIPLETEGTRRLHPDGRICSAADEVGQPCGPCQEMASLNTPLLKAIAKARETALEAEKARLHLDNMMVQYRDLASKRENSHGSIINRRMPPEILSTIFLFCLDSPEDLEKEAAIRARPDQQPLQFGAICRKWRDIAWSTPALWKTFSIRLDSSHHKEVDPFQIDITQQWLSRSGNLPLSIYIGMKDPSPGERGPQGSSLSHPILDIVKKYFARWQDLYLRLWIPWMANMAVKPSQAPKLRTLGLCPVGSYLGKKQKLWGPIQMSCQRFYIHAERLLSESRDRNLHQRFLTKLSVSWNTLIDLDLRGLSYNNCYELLKSTARLTRFKITDIKGFDPFEPSNQLTYPELQYFSISGMLSPIIIQSTDNFLLALHFPSLTELHYDIGPSMRKGLHSKSMSDFYCPNTFIGRMPHLKRLYITISNVFEGRRYIEALRFTHLVEEFHLKERDLLPIQVIPEVYSFDHEFECVGDNAPRPLLAYLSATNLIPTDNNTNVFLPALQSFTYENLRQPPWNDVISVLGPLSDINNARRRPLRNFRIICDCSEGIGVPDDVLRLLPEAAKAGINVSLQVKVGEDIESDSVF